MFNSFLNNYFGFNRQQRNGLLVLILISFTLLVVRVSYPYFLKEEEIVIENLPLFERKADSILAAKSKHYASEKKYNYKNTLFVFDPNTVSYKQLVKLGMKEKTARRFIKFRDKGFVFKTKQDLKKVYGISDKYYAILEPYILIEAPKESPPQQSATAHHEKITEPKTIAKKETQIKLELNTTDSISLVELNGIGPSFAKRILKYRSMLGGFVSAEQLKEVYGFTEEMYTEVSPHFTVNAALIKKINPATDDFKTINKHPYMSFELTKSLFNWRRKTDINSTTFKEIVNDEALYQKLMPYVKFE